MFKPGAYTQPLQRKQEFHLPVIPGYKTGRLFTEVINVSGYSQYDTRVLVENTHDTNTLALQLVGTNDYVSGPWANIGGPITVKPRGQRITEFSPSYAYLEFYGRTTDGGGTATGEATARVQLVGAAEWEIQSFDKVEAVEGGVYPPQLVKKYPDPAPPPA